MKDRASLALLLLALGVEAGFAWLAPTSLQRNFRTTTDKSYSRRVLSLPPTSLSRDEECSMDDVDAAKCLIDSGGYKNPNDEQERFALVSKVVVAEIESLRNSFPSFESPEDGHEGSNMIKFNKRKRRGSPSILMQSIPTIMTALEDRAEDHTELTEANSHVANLEYNQIVDDDEIVLVDVLRNRRMSNVSRAFVSAGPRKYLHFDPSKVNAAIVTCGGLCPGLNNVIRELVRSLYYLYGANNVWGVQGGYNGFHGHENLPPVLLTNAMVEPIHHKGGTILRSSRGGFDIDTILGFCEEYEINQLYIIGGDGTHRGAYAIHEACMERELNIAVAGIPKTIDNDIALIDRSFGFQSAVEAALAAIESARTEATCFAPSGVGIVKLMGRSAGFLAAFAALASGDVDAVLVPEVPVVLEGPDGILPFLRKRIKEQGYAIMVVAEGAGEELIGVSTEVDAGGNRKLLDIGEFMKKKVADYFMSHGTDIAIKYVDPSYMVRSVPANGADAMYCMQLAQNAVHGAMAGLTGFSTGLINRSPVFVPIPQMVSKSPRQMDPYGKAWEEILTMTGQPNTAPPREETEEDPMIIGLDDGQQLVSGISPPIVH